MKHILWMIAFITSSIQLSSQTKLELAPLLKQHQIPALGLGIIEQGKLSQIQVFGNANTNTKASYNTIFNVASVTKPVTAMVALKLISQGKWKLDEPLYHYWVDKDVKDNPKTKLLTTRHVLSHQTGFPNWRKGTLKFMFAPGTKYQYSGEGFEYLRKALEHKFHKTLNQLATELIFDPLKMEDTQYIWNERIDSTRVATGFDTNGKAYKTHCRKISNGADDLLTTVKDYSTFLISVMNGEGLSATVFKEMQKTQATITKQKHFGLGFCKYVFKDGNYALSHGGADNGVQTLTVFFPKTKKGIVIFTNSDNGYKAYEKILTTYFGSYGSQIIEIETGKKALSENIQKPYKPINKELHKEILALDEQFFKAYNTCDLETQASMYSNSIEFFHDKGGLITSKQEILESTEKYICGKVTRELVKGSTEVYPIKDYGAIQIGYHKFHNKQEPNAPSVASKFIMVWHKEKEAWKITKVISLH